MDIIELDKFKKEKENNNGLIDMWEGFVHSIIAEYTIESVKYGVIVAYNPLINDVLFLEDVCKIVNEDDIEMACPMDEEDAPGEVIGKINQITGSIKEAYKYLQNEGFDIKSILPIYSKIFESLRLNNGNKVIRFALRNVVESEWGIQYIGYTKEFAEHVLTNRTYSSDNTTPEFTFTVTMKPYDEQYAELQSNCNECEHKEDCEHRHDCCDDNFIDYEDPKLMLNILDDKYEDDIIEAMLQLLYEKCFGACLDEDSIWNNIYENTLVVSNNIVEEHNYNVEETVHAVMNDVFVERADLFTHITLIVSNQPEQLLVPVCLEGIADDGDDDTIFVRCLRSAFVIPEI